MLICNHSGDTILPLCFLQATWESNEVSTQTESCALSCCDTNGWGDKVQDGKDSRCDEGKSGDLVDREALPGDKDGRTRDNKTLNQILDGTVDNFRDVHLISIFGLKKFFVRQNRLKKGSIQL
jgi:hypothetical protein